MNKKSFSLFISASILSLAPLVTRAAAACPVTPKDLRDLICKAMELVNPVIGLLTGLGVLYFVWHVVQYVAKAGDEKNLPGAKKSIYRGIAGLVVLFSFWGFVELLRVSIFG